MLHNHPSMTEQDNGYRRRAEDFKLHPEHSDEIYPVAERRHTKPRRRAPGRSFLRKFRQPIIGLSLVGAAAPLIHGNATQETQPDPATNAAAPTEAEQARQAMAQSKNIDIEDQLAEKVAAEHHDVKTASIIGTAVKKFDIDEKLAHDIYEIAQEEGIEPKLAYGLVKTESSFKNEARSHVGALGLTQVMPRTAKWLVPGTKPKDLHDQRTNLRLGFKYLNQMINKYDGNVRNALLAYNRGPGTVDRILKRGGNPNNGYADKVLGGWRSS
jgi:soluble lytic murein transglycosylase-like protein